MTIQEMLKTLNSLGIHVSLHNNDLKITAPKNLAIPELMDIIKENKDEIIDVLLVSTTSNNFSNFIDSVDYVDDVRAANSTQLPENNFSERMDYENKESTAYPLNPANASKKIRFSSFNLAFFDQSYPKLVPEFFVQAAIEALKSATPEQRAKWLDELTKWQAIAEDQQWAASVIKQLSEELDRPEVKTDARVSTISSRNVVEGTNFMALYK